MPAPDPTLLSHLHEYHQPLPLAGSARNALPSLPDDRQRISRPSSATPRCRRRLMLDE